MNRKILIIASVVLITLTACKKESTAPTASTTTNSNTVSYGTYTGADFTLTTVGISYKRDGSVNQNNPKQESTMVMPSSGYATITKGANEAILLSGGGFSASEMKFNGTNFIIDKKITSAINSMTKTIEGNGTLINNNKNLKFYVQNANKTSKKEFYHSSLQVYSNEIYEINNKIIQGNVPLENLINEIEFLKKKYNVYKNKEKSNVYLTLLNLTNTIRHKSDANRYQIISNDLSRNLVIVNNNLNEKIQELEACINNPNNTNSITFKLPEVKLVKNIYINKKYMIYIMEYGVPEDGIFLESLLEIIENIYI